MPAPLVILAPSLAPAVGSAVGVGLGGSLIYTAAAVDQFRRGPAGLPPLTGLENGLTLQEKIADYFAGARVPVISPEPPKLPGGKPDVGQAVAAGVAGIINAAANVGGQLWGLLNGRPEVRSGSWGDPTAQQFNVPGGAAADLSLSYSFFGSWQGSPSFPTGGITTGGSPTVSLGRGRSVQFQGFGGFAISIPAGAGGVVYTIPTVSVSVLRESGSWEDIVILAGGTYETWAGWPMNVERSVTGGSVTADGVEFFASIAAPAGFVPPQVEPERKKDRPMAPPLAPPAPPLTPSLPPAPREPFSPGTPPPLTPSPQPPGTPTPGTPAPGPGQPAPGQVPIPGQPPAPVPPGFPAPSVPGAGAFPRPGPLIVPQIPGSQPTGPDGMVQTRPQPRPTITRPGAEVIGGIAIPNRPPAPTLTGIAAEVGRIEQKIAFQLRQPDPPGLELLPLLEQILEALQASEDQGVYLLGGPCERDSEGQPIPFEDTQGSFEYGGQLSALDNISSRIDALAELIQYHKLLRQPTCLKSPPALGGEWVTVNFEQET